MLETDGGFHVPKGLDERDAEPEQYDVEHFKFPGPVAEAFFHDASFVSFIQGPYGSAKTTTAFFKLLARASRMPVCKDGVRRYRALVLRDTYRRMERTAIRSWNKWFPKTMGHWEGGQDRPSKHVLMLEDLDGVPLQFEIEFAAVGDLDVEDFMGGYEITDLYLNEVNLQSQDVLTYGAGRCGRYPSIKDLPAGTTFDYGVIGDLNAPDPDSWLTKLRFGDLDEAMAQLGKTSFFLQPGGRSAAAENVHNLPPDYYARLAAANAHQSWWVARMIDNKSGYSRNGQPVYASFNGELHVARQALVLGDAVPLLGFDGGLHPAGVIGRRNGAGQFLIVAEFYPGRCGPTRFATEVLTWLQANCPDYLKRKPKGWCDPSAFDGVDGESGELSFVQTLEAVLGFRVEPAADTNDIPIRVDAVTQMLDTLIDGAQPALVLSQTCTLLARGMASQYRFHKVRRAGGDEFADTPLKNDASNLQDALQYLVLGARGKDDVIRNKTGSRPARRNAGQPRAIKTEFSIFGGSA